MSSESTEFTPSDYTVGWVCALPKEQTAATAMLDQIHPDLPKPLNDHNTYTLGSVGKHNIVIACLPKGLYGTNSAATVATRMVNTFPSIKFGLMVGIGGGIPPNVRLGDVVVSTPVDMYPGVVQWDLGKAESDGNFKRTGALSNPPSTLLTALTKLETQHEMRGSKIPEYLDDLKEQWPRLAAKYIKSDSLLDTLTTEANGGQSKTREMQVHYGLIASGNQVIKDAKLRDILNSSLGGNVLCVEMEAAGLMNDFPCLVIRGICDYADSHKDKAWQEHAAAVAAAFAKELLFVVPAQEVEQMSNIRILLEIDSQLKEVSKTVNELHYHQRSKEDQGILDWLTPIDYTLQQNDYFKLRQPGTGQWLLDSDEYQNWLSTDRQTLFCPGIPGAGKTILASIIIDDLHRRFHKGLNIGIAYIYCNFRRNDEQSIDQLLINLLKQLSHGRSPIPNVVKDLYKDCTKRKVRPSLAEISAAFWSVAAMYSRVYVVIDALDECQARSAGCVLKEIFSLQKTQKVNFVATSRFITEIVNKFEGFPSLEIRASEKDLRNYLDDYVINLPSFVRDNPGLQKEVKESIAEAVDGMFLLAQLYVRSLEDRTTLKALRTALKRFHKHESGTSEDQRLKILKEAYDHTMQRVKSQQNGFCQLAEKVLIWITCAQRPLTVSELQHALGVEVGKKKLDEDNLPQIEEMISVCAGLVIADEESGIIRLVHYTTQEYFEQTKNQWFPTGDADVTKICLSYLSFNDFASGRCKTKYQFDRRIYSNRLYDYAAGNWGYHARKVSGLNSPIIIDFLQSGPILESSIQAMMSVSRHIDDIDEIPSAVTGLHLAAYFGLDTIVGALISKVRTRELVDSEYRTPLSWAAENGHVKVARLLIQDGVRVDSEDIDGRTPLIWAASNGHEAVMKLLIQSKADINAADLFGVTALHLVARRGYLAAISLLLEHGANIHAKDLFDGTPLVWAIENDSNMATQMLLATDARVNYVYQQFDPYGAASHIGRGRGQNDGHKLDRLRNERFYYDMPFTLRSVYRDCGKIIGRFGRKYSSPLQRAVEKEDEFIVKMLIEKGSQPFLYSDKGITPLSLAMDIGNESIIRMLFSKMERGACAGSRYGHDQTLLSRAAERGYQAIVESLLEMGADPETYDSLGRTPLCWASINGHEEVVKLLLAQPSVDPDMKAKSKDSYDKDRTPLSWAAGNGHEAVVKLLLAQPRVDPDYRPTSQYMTSGWAPLTWAAMGGHHNVVKLLLATGRVDPDLKIIGICYKGRTPLSIASEYGHEEVVKLLLGTGKVNPDSQDESSHIIDTWRWSKGGRTPLSYATAGGHLGIVKLLLETDKVNTSSKDEELQTPLSRAYQHRHQTVVRYLLESGVDDEGITKSPWWAAIHRDGAAVKHLPRGNSDPQPRGREGYDAESNVLLMDKEAALLEAASAYRDEAIIKLVLEKGAYTKSGIKNKRILLSYAAKHGHEAIVRHLFDRGVEVDSKGRSERTPLSYAAENGHDMVVKLLLERGADPSSKRTVSREKNMLLFDNHVHEMTPLAYAAENGHKEVVKLLLEDGRADPDKATGSRRRTPLSYAAENGHVAVVKLLLTKDEVNLESRSPGGWTPLLFAAIKEHETVVNLLLEKGANSNPECIGLTQLSSTVLSFPAMRQHKGITKLLERAQRRKSIAPEPRTTH